MTSLPDNISFDDWVQSLFSHPEGGSDTSFWWDEDYDPPMWNEYANPERALEYMTRLFDAPGFLLRDYSPHQINAGLYYMASPASSCYMHCLRDEGVPWKKRREGILSIQGLYRDLWAPMHANNIIASSETIGLPGQPQSACYMWWDVAVIWPGNEISNRTAFIEAIFDVFEEGLKLTAESCLESIIHGIGHYYELDPIRAAALINSLLKRTDLSADIRTYAQQARTGHIQ